MGHFIFLLTLLVITVVESQPSLLDAFIDEINGIAGTWTAGRNIYPSPSTPMSRMRRWTPDHPRTSKYSSLRVKQFESAIELPVEFDSRDQWPECPSIGNIIDQGSCSSCWAYVAATTMEDRVCIHSGGNVNHKFSAMDIMGCCSKCGVGCTGGSPEEAWQYWIEHGIVSGGPYASNEGCVPYRYAPCEHDPSGHRPQCIDPSFVPLPKCRHNCVRAFNGTYESDRNYGGSAYAIGGNEANMREEIFTNGPIITGIALYEDILHYKKGIYRHVLGKFIGAHAVRVIGWGEENGVAYWLIANSWNTDWGENGFFKILRGSNHCHIEQRISAGLPKDN